MSNKTDEIRMISEKEAIALLPKGNKIHTFRNTTGMLIGADHSRWSLLADIKKYKDTLQIAGSIARGMKHGLILEDSFGYLFIETDKEKLDEFDPLPK